MSSPRSRAGRLILFGVLGGLLAGLAVCAAAASFFDFALPQLGQGAAPFATPVVWSGLPRPVALHPQWTSFTFANTIRAVAVQDRLLWAATDGGAVVFDLAAPNAAPVKFTAEHGLAANRLTSVAAAPDGTLWFGSAQAGLSQFDGQTWRTFGLAEGLPANEIRDITFAPDGALWVATPRGLARRDGERWQTFSTFGTGLPSDDVRAVAASPGGVWAATAQGVAYFDGRQWQTYTYQNGLANDDTSDLALAADGSLWVATHAGLSHFDGVNWLRFTKADGLLANELQSLAVAPDGAVWLTYAAAGTGLTRFDGLTSASFSALDGLASEWVYTVAAGPGGEVWAGTADGLSRYDGRAWTLLEAPSEIPSNDLRGLLAARGAVWAASPAGVSRYDGARWRLFTALDGLAAEGVYALALGPDDTPWAAFQYPTYGVSSLSEADRWTTLPCRPAGPATRNVVGGAAASDGSVWFATDHGVSRFDGRAWSTFTSADGLPADAIRALVIAPNGEVWAATPHGLAVYHGGRWTGIAPDAVRLLSIDPAGTVWGVTAGGLARLEGRQLAPVPGAPGQEVRALLATAEGVWLATEAGVGWWNGDEWRTFTQVEGLASNDVTALALGPQGEVWAAFGDARLGFTALTVEGVQATVAGSGVAGAVRSLAVAPDGTFWFGTNNGGVAHYDPTLKPSGVDRALGPQEVRGIFRAADGLFWVATFGDGVYHYDGVQWKKYAADVALAFSSVQAMAVDPTGAAWLGTSVGVVRLAKSGCDSDQRIAPMDARAAVAAPGGVWFATPVNGGLRWNDDGQSVWHAASWTGTDVSALAVAPDDAVWFFGNKGLVRLLGRAWQTFPVELSLFPGPALSLTVTPNGDLWAGTTQGVRHYDGRDWQAFTTRDGLADDTVQFAVTAPDGSIWFATPGGLSRYQP